MRYDNEIMALGDRVIAYCVSKMGKAVTLPNRRLWVALKVQAELNRKDLDSGLAGAADRARKMAESLGVK